MTLKQLINMGLVSTGLYIETNDSSKPALMISRGSENAWTVKSLTEISEDAKIFLDYKVISINPRSPGSIKITVAENKYANLDVLEETEEAERWQDVDTQIIARFHLEPRAARNSSESWLVVWDRFMGDYVKVQKGSRTYAKFSNSQKAIEWLRSKYVGKEEKL